MGDTELARLQEKDARRDAQLTAAKAALIRLEETQERSRSAELLRGVTDNGANVSHFEPPGDAALARRAYTSFADFAHLIAENDAVDSAALRQRREQLLQ